MNKQLWTVSIVVVLVGVLLFIVILNITDERNQLARKLDYDKVKEFYYIKDMPYKFHEHILPTSEDHIYNDGIYISVYESWINGEKEIKMILLETKFRFYNELTYVDVVETNRNARINPVTVKNVDGYYGSYTEDVYAIEYIELIIDGVFYKITVQHTNPKFLGEDFMVNFVNGYLVN